LKRGETLFRQTPSVQRGALLIGSQHLGLALLAVALLGGSSTLLAPHRGTGTAAPAAVVAVLDDVCAAAVAAVMNLAGLDHRYPPLQG